MCMRVFVCVCVCVCVCVREGVSVYVGERGCKCVCFSQYCVSLIGLR